MKRLILIYLVLLTAAVAMAQRFPPGALVSSKRAAAGGSSTLNTSLIAYWKLDETSGTRVDSEPTGTAQDLTDSGSTASATGKISNGADFEFGSPTYVYRSDSADLSLGTDTDFTIAAWVKFESDSGFSVGIVGKNGGLDDTDEYVLLYNAGIQRFQFKIAKNGTGSQTVADSNIGIPSNGVWYHVVAIHDSAADQIKLIVNNGTADTASWSGGTQDGTAEFRIGCMSYNPNLVFDGVIDEVGFWKKALSASEITELYNSGIGKTCCGF